MAGKNDVKSNELSYILNPKHSRKKWILFYSLLAVLFGTLFYVFIGRVRTHTLPTGQISLNVPYSTYLVGENVSISITNNFNSPIYAVNHCPDEPLGVYKFVHSTWQRVHAKANKVCTDEDRQVSIPALSTRTLSLAPWSSMFNGPGKYRLVMFLEYYNALPYQDIEFINKPLAATTPTTNPSPTASTTTGTSTTSNSSTSSTPTTTPSSTPVITPSTQAVTYTVHVNSSGNYDKTSFALHTGDSIQFIYTSSFGEARTRFTGSPTISTFTLDKDRTSRTIQFSSAGTWTFKADDHSGNTGHIVVT